MRSQSVKWRMWINVTTDEANWVKHAAKLKGLPPREYVVRAINAALCRDGVDAVLIVESKLAEKETQE